MLSCDYIWIEDFPILLKVDIIPFKVQQPDELIIVRPHDKNSHQFLLDACVRNYKLTKAYFFRKDGPKTASLDLEILMRDDLFEIRWKYSPLISQNIDAVILAIKREEIIINILDETI
jgi:hypothetical protein